MYHARAARAHARAARMKVGGMKFTIHHVRNFLLFRSRGRATRDSTYPRKKVESGMTAAHAKVGEMRQM